MTVDSIVYFFDGDNDLLKYFDPFSSVTNNRDAGREVYEKLVEYARSGNCFFKKNDIGYIFYSKKRFLFWKEKTLISFCVKSEFRTKENLALFSEFIKKEIGKHFTCFLYARNKRAINFLRKMGMRIDITMSTNLVTLLYI